MSHGHILYSRTATRVLYRLSTDGLLVDASVSAQFNIDVAAMQKLVVLKNSQGMKYEFAPHRL